jgi:hypothetical protein
LAPAARAWYPRHVKPHHRRIALITLIVAIAGWLAWTMLLVPTDLSQ